MDVDSPNIGRFHAFGRGPVVESIEGFLTMNSWRTFHLTLLATVVVCTSWCVAADVLHMKDGRVLKGQIVQENPRLIVFEYVDPRLGIQTSITVPLSQVEKIERNVKEEVQEESSTGSDVTSSDGKQESGDLPSDQADSPDSTMETPDAGNTRFYIVPMKGQVGTDITPRIYEAMVEDINELKPDVVIIKLDSSDLRNEFKDGADDIIEGEDYHMDPNEVNMWNMSEMRKLRQCFSTDIDPSIRQVLWCRDAVGSSSVLGLAWPELYMHPEAMIGGMSATVQGSRNAAGDANVEAKFGSAAYEEILGITRYGRDMDRKNPTRERLITALTKPEAMLSVGWQGRMPIWSNTLRGEVSIDDSDEVTVLLPAYICDDVCLSHGTAETLEDLAVLLGERNFVVVEGQSNSIFTKHNEGWRDAWARAVKYYMDYRKWMGRLNSRNRKSNLNKAESALKRVRALAIKWPELAIRSRGTFSKTNLDLMLLELEDIRKGASGRSGGGGGGGSRGPAGS